MSRMLITSSANILLPSLVWSVVADHLSGDHDMFLVIATDPTRINAARIATSMGGDVQARVSI